jgi:osmotically-inducible protein OsmY
MAITPVQDSSVTRGVQGLIQSRGLGSPCKIVVQTMKGEVTLSGTVRSAQQKLTAVNAARSAAGVRRIIDRMTVTPVASKWAVK